VRFETIRELVAGVPFIDPQRARVLYDFILEHRPTECLELGFAHGVSSCYIAAALDELGQGRLTSVDLVRSASMSPTIEELLERTGLQRYVLPLREPTSYTWFLRKKIEELSRDGVCTPAYDFCFIDGPKNWTIDGFAFFLVDKLLRTGGWILFDDYNWTYGSSSKTTTSGINHLEMGPDELSQPHIELVVRLLVTQHPSYSEIRIQDDCWAWAHKTAAPTTRVVIENSYTFKALLLRVLRGAARRLRIGQLEGV
jgi:predicted O-methyltransferase YrrM